MRVCHSATRPRSLGRLAARARHPAGAPGRLPGLPTITGVGALQSFERRLSGLVQGAFAKVFKGSVEPVEIAQALTDEADRGRVRSASRTLVPNAYVVELGDRDHDRLAPYSAALGNELAAMLREHAQAQGYDFVGPVSVTLGHDRGLDTGVFRVDAEVSEDGARALAAEEVQPAPPAPMTPAPITPAPLGPAPITPAPITPVPVVAAPLAPVPGAPAYPPPAPAGPAPAAIAPPAAGHAPRTPSRLVLPGDRGYDLVAPVVRIGRARDVDLRLDDTAISRAHVEVRREGEGHTLVDLGSTNGTVVNGSRVSTHQLRDGDRILVGGTTLTYRAGG